MQHTYLRYECADSFALTTSAGSSNTPSTKSLVHLPQSIVLSAAGSQIVGFHLRTHEPCLKISHRQYCTGGIGTGRALNSDIVLCLALSSVASSSLDHGKSAVLYKVASGWNDGAVRIFDLYEQEFQKNNSMPSQRLGLAHSLLAAESEEFVTREPLLLNGHLNSPVTCLAFDNIHSSLGGEINSSGRLASGSSDGTIIVWDILAETGLFRFTGHRGAITDLGFVSLSTNKNTISSFDGIISSSLDSLVKVWDIDAQCCVQTIANHGGEVTCSSLVFLPVSSSDVIDEDPSDSHESSQGRWRLISGCSDGKVRVWNITRSQRMQIHGDEHVTLQDVDGKQSEEKASQDDICYYMGLVIPPPNVATSNEKIAFIQYHSESSIVGVARFQNKVIDMYVIRSVEEAEKKRVRRLRRLREKAKKKEQLGEVKKSGSKRGLLDDDDYGISKDVEDMEDGDKLDADQLKASDEFEYIGSVRASHKVKGFTFVSSPERRHEVHVLCSLATNSLEIHSVTKKRSKTNEDSYIIAKKSTMDIYGHPTGVRSIALTSDDSLACSISKSDAKLWNVSNRSCIGSISFSDLQAIGDSNVALSFYALCVAFLPGNSHVVVGSREGHLVIADISSGDIVYIEKNAHEGAIWSIDVRRPRLNYSDNGCPIAIMTGSADKSVKFWDLERQDENNSRSGDNIASHPMVIHTRTLQTSDDVVAVRYSSSADPSKRLVFVSTLDSQIRCFFDDTLKFFLSLYGHKLPALAIDSSDDDTILASGGADKSIKIFGLDFGDTHKTLYGHSDSITDLRFVRKTHYFFTASKDLTVRYWDADRFEQILLLNGHFAEVNCLAVSRTGAFVLSGGMDRQIRVWERTKDMVFLDEEKERALEEMFDKADGARGDEQGTATIMRRRPTDDEDAQMDDMDQPQSAAAVKRSVLSISSGDRIMEAIELADQETKDLSSFNRIQSEKGMESRTRTSNPLLMGMTPPTYILWVLRSIDSAELEQSLMVLPLRYVERVLYYLIILLSNNQGVEICTRTAVFIIKVHQNQIISNRMLSAPLRELRRLLKIRLAESRDAIGFNIAGIRMISKVAMNKKSGFVIGNDEKKTDIWAGLGLGSDVAAALQSKKTIKNK